VSNISFLDFSLDSPACLHFVYSKPSQRFMYPIRSRGSDLKCVHMFKIPLVTILRPALQGRRIYCVLLVRMRSFFSYNQRKVALSAGDLNECIVCPKAGRSDKLMERETMSANWRNEFAEFESQNQG
jgi:hypothetical protein